MKHKKHAAASKAEPTCIALDVTKVRSDIRVHHRMMLHIGATRPDHV